MLRAALTSLQGRWRRQLLVLPQTLLPLVDCVKYIDLIEILHSSLSRVMTLDADLLVRDNSERCITSRLAHHMQNAIDSKFAGSIWLVDVEFNRQGEGDDSKLLGDLQGCATKFTAGGQALVVPDLIVHDRRVPGRNLFIAEVKKTTNDEPRDCDRRRVEAFRRHYRYEFGAFIEFESRSGRAPAASVCWYCGGVWEEQAIRL